MFLEIEINALLNKLLLLLFFRTAARVLSAVGVAPGCFWENEVAQALLASWADRSAGARIPLITLPTSHHG